MGIFTNVKSSENNYSKSPNPTEKLNMSTKPGASDDREEGEIIEEFEDIISSDEEFSMRKRIEELEAKNAELEKIANISVSTAYTSGGYNDYSKKDSHHPDRYPLVSIDISDDEDYPPAPKMSRISKRRKSLQHSSSRHSSSSHRRRKRSSSPPPAPQYRQADKLLLSLFHERVTAHNSHSSKHRRKTKKTHSTKSSCRKSREYYLSDSDDDYTNFDSYNLDDNHEHFHSSDCDKSYSLNRDELRVALARNTHRTEQHASLKDRLTRKKENTDMFNFIPSVEDSNPAKEAVVAEEKEEVREKASSPVAEVKADTDDNMEEQELRILALKSAVLKKHMVRKKRNENVAYSPSDFDEIYKCMSESPSLNNIDEQGECNSMDISPVSSPKMILSDDGGIDTKPVDMDIVNSDSDCELPTYDKWIPIEQIPLPNSIRSNEEICNPTPIRYEIEQSRPMPPDIRYESVSVSPKNFDSEVDEEELALRALLLSKMNSPKVNKIVKEQPPKVVQVHTPDPDVSLEAEELRSFLINNMKRKAKTKNSSASVLKEAVRRLKGNNTSPSPVEGLLQHNMKTEDETEKELGQAITNMAKVNLGPDSMSEFSKKYSSSCGIRVKNIETLKAGHNFEVDFDAQANNIIKHKFKTENSKENPVVQNCLKNSIKKDIDAGKVQPTNLDAIKIIKKETVPGIQMNSSNLMNSVLGQNNKPTTVSKPLGRNLTVKIEKMILPNATLKPNAEKNISIKNTIKKVDCSKTNQIKSKTISGCSANQHSASDSIEKNKDQVVVEKVPVEDVDPKKCVKIEKQADGVNESENIELNSGKELLSKTAVNQGKVDAKDVESKTNQTLAHRILDAVDPKQVVEIQKEIVANVSSDQKITFPVPDNIKNEPLEDMSSEKIGATFDLKQKDEQGRVVEIECEDASTNQTKNISKTSDPKTRDEDVLRDSSIRSPIKDEILDSDLEKSLSTEDVSKASSTKLLLNVDPIDTIETAVTEALLPQEVSDNKITNIGKTEIADEANLEEVPTTSVVKHCSTMSSSMQETHADVDSHTTSKSAETHIQNNNNKTTDKPTTIDSNSKLTNSSNTFISSEIRQVKIGTKSIQVQIHQKQTVEITTNPSKLTNSEKVVEKPKLSTTIKNPCKSVIKNTLCTQKKILSSTSNLVAEKSTTMPQLPNQQPITTRTKIVKPNQIINQQTVDLKRKTNDNLLQVPVPAKKPKTDDNNRLITKAEIPQVPELIIQLGAAESESEYSNLSANEMEEDEDSRVRNFFNRSITVGNEYYDIASPISLPMESPCDTPTGSSSPIPSRTETPQPSVEKSIVNDFFEAKLEQFLKNVRSKVSVTTDSTVKTIKFEGKEIAPVISTPVAVRHLPEASQHEYRRLINRMKILERQKQAKSSQGLDKTSDSVPSDLKSTISDGDSKFLVRKVLVKNATAKPSPVVIQKPKSPEKTEKIHENHCPPPKTDESPQKSTSLDDNSSKSSKKNLLVLYENSYRKTGTSIICSLDKSIEMVLLAKKAKMAKLKHEHRLRVLRKEMDDVQKKFKEQQDKITKIFPEICNSHRAIESLKTRRLKINKAVTALGKNVIGPHYSMQNDQKSIILEKSKKLAAEIRLVNTMKLSDIEIMEKQNLHNLPDNAKKIITTAQNLKRSLDEKQLPAKSSSVHPPEKHETSFKIQIPANSLQEEQLPAHEIDESMPTSSALSSSTIITNEVPISDSQSPKILKKPVPEDIDDEDHASNTIVPEIFSNSTQDDDEKACSTTTTTTNDNGHEEALELEQPVDVAVAVAVDVVVVGDNNSNNEQAPEQTNMDENNEEENGGEQMGSAKLQDYVSPLSHLRDERHINPNGVVCPYQLMGQCDDKDCKYMHLED